MSGALFMRENQILLLKIVQIRRSILYIRKLQTRERFSCKLFCSENHFGTGFYYTLLRKYAQYPYLQHVATAVGINIRRLSNWWNGVPFSKTHSSRFAMLMPA
jgi:hypothetical protein